MNIDDIRREIDGLHKQSTRKACEDFTSALAAYWPTISRALADAKSDRRKANAFDAIAQRLVFIGAKTTATEKVEWSAWPDKTSTPSRIADGRDLLTAIESALRDSNNA